MSQEWSATVRVSFDEDVTPKSHAEAVATLSGAWADFLGTIEDKAADLEVSATMGLPNGRGSAEARAPAGTNGGPTKAKRYRSPNKPKMQVPAQSLAHGALPVESDE